MKLNKAQAQFELLKLAIAFEKIVKQAQKAQTVGLKVNIASAIVPYLKRVQEATNQQISTKPEYSKYTPTVEGQGGGDLIKDPKTDSQWVNSINVVFDDNAYLWQAGGQFVPQAEFQGKMVPSLLPITVIVNFVGKVDVEQSLFVKNIQKYIDSIATQVANAAAEQMKKEKNIPAFFIPTQIVGVSVASNVERVLVKTPQPAPTHEDLVDLAGKSFE